MAVDQLVRFFKLYLSTSIVALLEGALKGGFTLSLNDIVAMLGFVHQDPHLCLANLDHPTRDSKVFQLVVAVVLSATHRHNAWHCQGYQWFVPREDRNLQRKSEVEYGVILPRAREKGGEQQATWRCSTRP